MAQKMRVLITVKTYPLPSKKYDETVCTGGVTEDKGWVRLYPINYRYKPYWEWYDKYQWIDVDVEKHRQDPRPESYRPVSEITPVGEPLDTKHDWRERKKYVLAHGVRTMCYLNQQDQHNMSLGIVRPKQVTDFIYEKTEREWKPSWQDTLNQLNLFGPQKKPLEKIPYKFSYKFICEEPTCKGHTMMIEDWEAGMLFLKMRDKYKNEKIACEKVKEASLERLCSPDKDTHFFVGTILQYNKWIIGGVFYPPKGTLELF